MKSPPTHPLLAAAALLRARADVEQHRRDSPAHGISATDRYASHYAATVLRELAAEVQRIADGETT